MGDIWKGELKARGFISPTCVLIGSSEGRGKLARRGLKPPLEEGNSPSARLVGKGGRLHVK